MDSYQDAGWTRRISTEFRAENGYCPGIELTCVLQETGNSCVKHANKSKMTLYNENMNFLQCCIDFERRNWINYITHFAW